MSEEVDPAAELLAEIERGWAEADRARGRVIRPARRVAEEPQEVEPSL